MNIQIKKLHPNATAPTYESKGAGCFDLKATTVAENTHIGSVVHEEYPVVCGTGLAFEIPQGHAMLIFSRSGHGFKDDVRLANCVGVVDSDYRGEVKVKLTCDADAPDDEQGFFVKPGDRIAQALIIKADQVTFSFADDLTDTERGEGGFGSTGQA